MPYVTTAAVAVKKHATLLTIALASVSLLSLLAVYGIKSATSDTQILSLASEKTSIARQLSTTEKELKVLKEQDQVLINQKNQEEIKSIQDTYKKAATSYEKLVDIKLSVKKTDEYDKLFALTLKQLADKNYASASATLSDLDKKIADEKAKLAAAQAPAAGAAPANATASNAAPTGGYSLQKVSTSIGDFTVGIVAGDLGSTRVIVDTASDSDCRDNCPVLALGDYVARNGAYAGINGSYFCPASYPSCAGKTNSFDLLVMGKNKHYHNSDNNVYSTNPAVIFQGGSVRFVGQASQWGRDTSPDGVLSNYPLLLSGGNITFGGDGDPKKGSKGSRSFVASKGNTVYIGVVYNATVAEGAHALKALGMEHAMNLDSGGSTALWHGGYKAGPGRAIPNAILFVRK